MGWSWTRIDPFGPRGTRCQLRPRRWSRQASSASVAIGQPDLAIRGPADPDRNPGDLHDANRARFTILDVETGGFRHRGIDSSLSHALGRAALPTLDEQVRAAGQPAIPGSTQGAGRDRHGRQLDRPVHDGQ